MDAAIKKILKSLPRSHDGIKKLMKLLDQDGACQAISPATFENVFAAILESEDCVEKRRIIYLLAVSVFTCALLPQFV